MYLPGSSNSLRGILIPDLFGVDKIADYYGIAMFFSGVSAFLGLPMAGLFYMFSLYSNI